MLDIKRRGAILQKIYKWKNHYENKTTNLLLNQLSKKN